MSEITLIMAYGDDGVLGNHGALPWPNHAEDMRRFREATLGNTVIMGRKTYDSIGKPLPWRQNVVISRSPDKVKGNVLAVKDIHAAMASVQDTKCFVIGGAAIYGVAMPYATRILLTQMHGDFTGDVYFKIPFLHQFTEVSREKWDGVDGPATFIEFKI